MQFEPPLVLSTKKCKGCNEIKSVSEFYTTHKGRYYKPYCKPCENEYKKEWNRKNPDKMKEMYLRNGDKRRGEAKKWYHENKEEAKAKCEIWRSKNPDKIKVHQKKAQAKYLPKNRQKQLCHDKVGKALKSGKLIRPSACSRCQNTERRLHAHHDDYTKPLKVVWLCHVCHRAHHRELRTKVA